MAQQQNEAIAIDPVEVKPAASVWNEPPPTELDKQLEFFNKQGFLLLPGAASPQVISQMKQELERMAQQHASLPHIREGFDLEPKQNAAHKVPTFRKIGGITELSPVFNQMMHHRRIIDVLHAIMGPTLELWRDVCMMKPARVGREKPWHQDSVYWPWEPMNLVSAMTALDDATPENGCLQVIPGTHRESVQHYGSELRIDLTAEQQAQTYYVPLGAGDTLLFHSLLLHASEPNLSDQNRRVLIVSYKSPNLNYIGKGDQRTCPLVSCRES